MIQRPRIPRVRRATVVLVAAVAALALPLGALANHQFNDVPASASYHDDVEALVGAGITSGCGNGNYCPNQAVTRGQMAQFLNRLGSLDGATPPSVDADAVDGLDADHLTRISANTIIDTTVVPEFPSEVQYGGDLTIEAPVEGFVLVTANVAIQNTSCAAECTVWGQVEHVESTLRSNFSLDTPVSEAGAYSSLSWSAVFAVEAGTNTFAIFLSREDATSGTLNGWWGEATAHFGPFGPPSAPAIGGASGEGAPVSPLTKER
jgi:S-layer homology domain